MTLLTSSSGILSLQPSSIAAFLAADTSEDIAYESYTIDTLSQDGYSATFAHYLIYHDKFNVAHAVGTQKDLSMDMKVMTIYNTN